MVVVHCVKYWQCFQERNEQIQNGCGALREILAMLLGKTNPMVVVHCVKYWQCFQARIQIQNFSLQNFQKIQKYNLGGTVSFFEEKRDCAKLFATKNP